MGQKGLSRRGPRDYGTRTAGIGPVHPGNVSFMRKGGFMIRKGLYGRSSDRLWAHATTMGSLLLFVGALGWDPGGTGIGEKALAATRIVTVGPTSLSFGSSLDPLNFNISNTSSVQRWSIGPGDSQSDSLVSIDPYGGFSAQPAWGTGSSTVVVHRKSISGGTATIVVTATYTDGTWDNHVVTVTLNPASPIANPVPLIPIAPSPNNFNNANGYCGGVQVNGDPYPPCGTLWVVPQPGTFNSTNIVGFHYKYRVVQNDPAVPPPTPNANGVTPWQSNIVFNFFQLETPGSGLPGRGFMSQISNGRAGTPP